MKRHLRKLVLFLLLGAIVNVAVAWACALWMSRSADLWIDSNVGIKSSDSKNIPLFVQHAHKTYFFNQDSFVHEARSGYAAPGFDSYTIRSLGTRDWHVQSSAVVVGWPLRTLWASYIYYIDAVNVEKGAQAYFQDQTSGILASSSVGEGNCWIPVLPIWPGFAINTLFYAAILWVLFAAPGKVRRWRRSKRGLCPACAYPVGQSPTCTECGAAVTPAHHPATSSS